MRRFFLVASRFFTELLAFVILTETFYFDFLQGSRDVAWWKSYSRKNKKPGFIAGSHTYFMSVILFYMSFVR